MWHILEKTGLCDIHWRISGVCDIHRRKLGCVTYIGKNWVVWHTSEKTGWCDRHQRKLGGVTYIRENWVVWHTSEKTGWCNIHQRILGCVTNIRENWVACHTYRHPEKMCLFSVPLSWNTMTILNWKPLSVLDRHISSPLSLYINHRVLETVFSSCLCRKQVKQGHKIVADGWAGASNPRTFHPYTHAHFPLFDNHFGPTDRPTDGQSLL